MRNFLKKTQITLRYAVISLIFVFLSLVSCRSIPKDSVPRWYYNPQGRALPSEIAFIGEGRSEDERNALLLAYEDLNSRLYGYLGSPPSEVTYRELSTAGTVSEFDLRVIERHLLKEENEYVYYILALTNKAKVQGARSPNAQKESLIAEEAIKLIFEGDALMKDGYDVLALKKYLESMVLTYPLSQIETEYSFPVMLEEVLDIISSTRIEVKNVNEKTASCLIKVRRKDTAIPTRVSSASIRAAFNAEDSFRQIFTDSIVFSTNERGDFNFVPKNKLMVKRGTISFYLDIDREIEKISRFSKQVAERIREVLYASGSGFYYALEYSEGGYDISVSQLSDVGLYKPLNYVNSELSRILSRDNINNYVIDTTQVFSEYNPDYSALDNEILGKARGNDGMVLIGRIAQVSMVNSRNDVYICTLQTNVLLYDMKTKKYVYNNESMYINGFASTGEEALLNAYDNYVSMVYSVLKNNYS